MVAVGIQRTYDGGREDPSAESDKTQQSVCVRMRIEAGSKTKKEAFSSPHQACGLLSASSKLWGGRSEQGVAGNKNTSVNAVVLCTLQAHCKRTASIHCKRRRWCKRFKRRKRNLSGASAAQCSAVQAAQSAQLTLFFLWVCRPVRVDIEPMRFEHHSIHVGARHARLHVIGEERQDLQRRDRVRMRGYKGARRRGYEEGVRIRRGGDDTKRG
jgi:hypothetical protein